MHTAAVHVSLTPHAYTCSPICPHVGPASVQAVFGILARVPVARRQRLRRIASEAGARAQVHSKACAGTAQEAPPTHAVRNVARLVASRQSAATNGTRLATPAGTTRASNLMAAAVLHVIAVAALVHRRVGEARDAARPEEHSKKIQHTPTLSEGANFPPVRQHMLVIFVILNHIPPHHAAHPC